MLDQNLLKQYLKEHPEVGPAGQARLKFLLNKVDNPDSLLKQALEGNVGPDKLMPALQKGIVQSRRVDEPSTTRTVGLGNRQAVFPAKKADDEVDDENENEEEDPDEETPDSVPFTHPGQRTEPPVVEKQSRKQGGKKDPDSNQHKKNFFASITNPFKRGPKTEKVVVETEEEPNGHKTNVFIAFTERGREFIEEKWKIIAGVVLALIILIVVIWFVSNWTPTPPSVVSVQSPQFSNPLIPIAPVQTVGLPKPHLLIRSIDLWLVILTILALFEGVSRGEVIPVDFLSPLALVGTLIAGQFYGHDASASWFWFMLGASMLGMVISTFYNPSEEGSVHWWDKYDTTHWYVAAVVLIFINWGHPEIYPAYLPLIVPILVAIVAIGKEYFRQLAFSLIATVVGIYPALVQNVAWISVVFAVEVLLAVFAHQQGWVTVRQTPVKLQIPANVPVLGGRGLTLIIAWDLVLFYIIEVAVIGYLLYGNYPIAVSR